MPRINAYKITVELFIFEKPLYLRAFRHRKRTVILIQNYCSFLVTRRGQILALQVFFA